MANLVAMEMGSVLGEDAKAEINYQTNWQGSDVAATAIRFAEQNLLGAGIESPIGNMDL